MDKIFAKTLKTYLSPPSQADFFKNTGIKPFLLCDEKLYGQKKKKKKKMMIRRSCIAGKWLNQ